MALLAGLACLVPSAAALPEGLLPHIKFTYQSDDSIGLGSLAGFGMRASSDGNRLIADVCWHFTPGQEGRVGLEYTGSGAVAYFPFVGPGSGSPPSRSPVLSDFTALDGVVAVPQPRNVGPGTQEAGASGSC